jgi:hypothetical protein
MDLMKPMMLRINTNYSKWSVWILVTALLSLCIINFLFFSGEDIFFEEPFLYNVFFLYIVAVEIFAVLSQNRILRAVSYLLMMGLCGFVFIDSILYFPMLFFAASFAMKIFIPTPVLYIILVLCSGVLSFSAVVSLLKLYAGE